ncbi:Sulfide dehydrogenase subunit alpha [uncultured archaeon]|nr:Sulfide dehydrogenase subunit alpha [uncultured archaeon]
MKQFYDQLKKYEGIKIMTKDVESVKKEKDLFIIKTKKDEFSCKALILATGTERRKLNIPGEQELTGKGVSYCVTCDAFFFKGKTVGVIGGSDCAATSALALTDLAKKVYVIYRGEKLRCEELTTERIEDKKNAEVIYSAIPTKINGKDKVESLEISQKGKKQEIKLDGIFVEVGATPLTNFLKELNVKLDKEGYIIVDEEMSTSVKGIFAAGDITHHKLKQVVVASGQGAIAAKAAYNYLKDLEN